MTFEQFQATRRWVEDVGAATGTDLGDDHCPGYLYAGDLHIFAPVIGACSEWYVLEIGTKGMVSADLASLERDLYAYGIDDGVLEQDS